MIDDKGGLNKAKGQKPNIKVKMEKKKTCITWVLSNVAINTALKKFLNILSCNKEKC